MQKDIQTSKGQERSDFSQTAQKVGNTAEHKMKQVGHDINAGLKENVGVGVGNYSSGFDRMEFKKHEEKYEKNKDELKEEREEKKKDNFEETGMLGHKVQEIGRTVNATLKQNVGIGIGNYSSEVDREEAEKHQEKFEEKLEENKKKLEEKKEETKEKLNQGETSLYGHKLQELGHNINAKLKENLGVGIGDYSSEQDRKIAEEHREGYMEKVKEEGSTEVTDSRPIVHTIKEVAHKVNATLKEMIGVGVGNYSSEVDRELIDIHHHKYEEKIHQYQEKFNSNNTNQDLNEKGEELKNDVKEIGRDVKEDVKEKGQDIKEKGRELKNDVKQKGREAKNDIKENFDKGSENRDF